MKVRNDTFEAPIGSLGSEKIIFNDFIINTKSNTTVETITLDGNIITLTSIVSIILVIVSLVSSVFEIVINNFLEKISSEANETSINPIFS